MQIIKENDMKHTTLTPIHEALGAKMVEFAGYYMPIQYKNLLEEHHAVRNQAGMFDVSHMGEFWVEGQQALALLQYINSNDISKLESGQVQYSCFPNKEGGIVDDLLVYCINPEKYMLVVNASNMEKDMKWILENNATFGAKVHDASDQTSLFALQGPKAIDILQPLSSIPLSEIPYYHFQIGRLLNYDNILISNTGYTGAGGFEIYMPNEIAIEVWNAIMKSGKSYGLQPTGLGARDTLRLEMGFCLYGNDINDSTSPLEAGLGWITKFNKDFVNKAALQAQKEQGVQRKLVGFELIDRGVPRKGYPLYSLSGEKIGEVTSGTQSPSLGKPIGMGYVSTPNAKPGTEILIEIRDKKLKAVVVKTPFYTK